MKQSLLNRVPCVPACQRGLRANVLACQRGLRANVTKACQLLIFKCQRAIRRANVSTWRANVPDDVPIFQFGVPACQKACQFLKHSSFETFLYFILLYEKLYTVLDIIFIHIMCICIVH